MTKIQPESNKDAVKPQSQRRGPGKAAPLLRFCLGRRKAPLYLTHRAFTLSRAPTEKVGGQIEEIGAVSNVGGPDIHRPVAATRIGAQRAARRAPCAAFLARPCMCVTRCGSGNSEGKEPQVLAQENGNQAIPNIASSSVLSLALFRLFPARCRSAATSAARATPSVHGRAPLSTARPQR